MNDHVHCTKSIPSSYVDSPNLQHLSHILAAARNESGSAGYLRAVTVVRRD